MYWQRSPRRFLITRLFPSDRLLSCPGQLGTIPLAPPGARSGNSTWRLWAGGSMSCALIQWIQSDSRLRTDDELIAELVRELGFQRRGPRIEAVCREALRLAKWNDPEDRVADYYQPTA